MGGLTSCSTVIQVYPVESSTLVRTNTGTSGRLTPPSDSVDSDDAGSTSPLARQNSAPVKRKSIPVPTLAGRFSAVNLGWDKGTGRSKSSLRSKKSTPTSPNSPPSGKLDTLTAKRLRLGMKVGTVPRKVRKRKPVASSAAERLALSGTGGAEQGPAVSLKSNG